MLLSENSCLILLTYKGQILLLQKDDVVNNSHNAWHFIEKLKENNRSTEETITQEVERETEIRLDNVKLILSLLSKDRKEYVFHATLTDKNVNNIKRREGSNLSFFKIQELHKLQLQTSTQFILSKYRTVIENLPLN